MKSISGILVLTGLIIALLFITGCTSTQTGNENSEGLTTIRYGGQLYPGEFVLAGDPSIWDKYGIEVEHTLFSSGAENNEALVAGVVDINCGSDTKTVSLFNAIPDEALIIGKLQSGNRYTTIIRKDAEYTSWEDLKGKTVATRFGTGAELVLRMYYEEEGLSWDDFNYVNLKIEDMAAALEQGQIEAFTAWEPTPAIAEAMGIGKVLRTYGDVSSVPVCLHTTKSYAATHEDEIVRFLAAQLDKADLITNNPEEAAYIASKTAAERGIDISPEAFITVFNRIDFSIDFDEDTINDIEEAAAFLYEQDKTQSIPSLSYDKSYLEKAIALRASK